MAAASDVADLAVRLRHLVWSWRCDDVAAAASALGWKVVEHPGGPDALVTLDSGWAVGGGEATAECEDGGVAYLTCRVTDIAADADEQAALVVAHDQLVEAMAGAIGPPARRLDAGRFVEWELDQVVIHLNRATKSIRLRAATPAVAARARDA